MVMFDQQAVLPKVSVVEQSELEALMAEPEAQISDAPRYVELPQAIWAAILSPEVTKNPPLAR
jgi:hypothetical protein